MSSIPDFLKAEEDVVVLLQIMSDYINNAYRNVSSVKKFKFKVVTLENAIVPMKQKLQKLADLFSLAESRDVPMLYLSKVEDINNLEKNKYSQDPFNEPATENVLIATANGLTQRIIQFNPTDVSKVRSRKLSIEGNSLYYEVFFTATLLNIQNVPSNYEIDLDDDGDLTDNYIVNYYNQAIINPNSLDSYYIKFDAEQVKVVSDYVGLTKTLILNSDFGIVPDSSSIFDLEAYNSYAQNGGIYNTVFLGTDASSVNGFYNNYKINVLNGTGNGQVKTILSYNGTTKEATVDSIWRVRLQGLAQSASTNSIVLNNTASSITDFYKDLSVEIVAGTGVGQTKIITSYDGNTKQAIVNSSWSVVPDGTSQFRLLEIPTENSKISIVALTGKVFTASRNKVNISPDSLPSNIDDKYNGFTLKITSGKGSQNGNLEWSNDSNYYLEDLCTNAINDLLWEPIDTITSSNSVVPSIFNKYGSVFASGYANSINSYKSPLQYSADLSMYVTSGYSTQLYLNSAISIGEINGTPQSDYLIGLSSLVDGIYLSIYQESTASFIFKERVFNSIPLNTLLEGNVKIVFNDGLVEVYWNNLLKYVITKKYSQTKIGFRCSTQNSLGTTSHGFIDNIYFYAKDDSLPNKQFISVQGNGLFYARDLTNIDKNEDYINRQTGNNIYTDPIFNDPDILDNDLFYSKIESDLSKRYLKVPYTTGSFSIGDTIARVNGINILKDHIAKVKELITESGFNYLVITNVSGDWISGNIYDENGVNLGNNFAKITGSSIDFTSAILSNSVPWNPEKFSYNKNDLVTYKNIKYLVKKIHTPSISKSPDVAKELYETYMYDNGGESGGRSLISYDNKISYNPYMWGLYKVKHLMLDEEPDLVNKNYSEICNDLYVQPAEEFGIKFRYAQRDWLFNPRVAEKHQLNRNGWLEATKLNEDNYDIVNSTLNLRNGSVLFTKQNLFDVTNNNPSIAESSGWYKFNVNTVEWQRTTSYTKDSFNVSKDKDNSDDYIIDVNVSNLFGEQEVILKSSDFTVSVGTDLVNLVTPLSLDLNTKIFLETTGALPYTLKQKVPYFVSAISPTQINISKSVDGSFITFLNAGIGTHTLVNKLILVDGDIVELTNQTNTNENGKYRITKNGKWVKLDKRTVIKIRDISVDYTLVEDIGDSDDPVKYEVYSDSEVDSFILNNPETQIFKLDSGFITNFKFVLPSIDGIDTTASINAQYDPRFDANTVAYTGDMDPAFAGVPDMGYPLIEKIERLAYQKDPEVIDLELIGYLAKYLGYDITQIQDDITESSVYNSDSEREKALRRAIRNLPQYNTLKSTGGGLEAILLVFGVVGNIVNLWTDQNAPYDNFVEDYNVKNYIYSNRESGIYTTLIPTPHFFLQVDINSTVDNDLNTTEVNRIIDTVKRYKPINTVFDGVVLYLKTKLRQRISLSPMHGISKFSTDIGYKDISYSEELDNGC